MSKKHKLERAEAKLAKLSAKQANAVEIVVRKDERDEILDSIDENREKKNFVKALDQVCIGLSQVPPTNSEAIEKYESRLRLIFAALCGDLNCTGSLDDLEQFLERSESKARQLIASTWMRAAASCTSFPISKDFERILFKIVDNCFLEVLQRLQVPAKAQPYEKRKVLINALNELERELHGLIDGAADLRVIGTLRQSFMKPFKSPMSQAAIWPFLPEDIRLETQIAALFQSVTTVADAQAEDVMESFENASEAINTYVARADQFGTKHSATILAGLGIHLLRAVNGYMEQSPIAKPARLKVDVIPKKYPLLSKGANLRVTFQIQNLGPGTAQEVTFSLDEILGDGLKVEKSEWFLGSISDKRLDITVPMTIVDPTDAAIISVSVTWKNFDNTTQSEAASFELDQQRKDVDWEKNLDPYSLEPVDNEAEFVGRTDALSELMNLSLSPRMGSSYLYGQKRVGKTSLVKTLRDKIDKSGQTLSPFVIYLERGEFRTHDPSTTIENLGIALCRKLTHADRRFSHLVTPVFKDAFAPFIGFTDEIARIAPDFRALFVFDEFDELPMGLYKRTEVGDAFFGSLRSLTNKSAFGLILVGSENMRHVIHFQGHALNKLKNIELDYFDREGNWEDFQELVRRPVRGILDIEDDAIVDLHAATSGNPFFAKMICGRLFKIMHLRRDCFVTRVEMQEAMQSALRQDMAINNVQHFWTDGIFEIEAKHEEISLRRRKILLALAYAGRQILPIRKEVAATICREKFGIESHVFDEELQELESARKIVRNIGGTVEFVVPFFLRWLTDSGIKEIIAVSIDKDASLRRSREEEAARIQPAEILTITQRFSGGYKGQPVSEDRVRAWLNQFGDSTRQRLIFSILRGLKFYSQSEIREKVREAHGIVSRTLVHVIETGKRKRSDILVSYLDGPGKSGARYAKVYADENSIYSDNVVERSQLGSRLQKDVDKIGAIVFVDDVVGTGNSAAECFEILAKDESIVAVRDRVQMFFIAVCGLNEGVSALDRRLDKLQLQVRVHVCDPLSGSDKVFSDQSRFFSDQTERNEALAICKEIGATLEKRRPLGYGDCQLAIVFEDTVPNNSLPVLWKKKKDWTPLFVRD